MLTHAEIETYLAVGSHERMLDDEVPFSADMSYEAKQAWLVNHFEMARNILFKYRGFGKTAWTNFLETYKLKEQTILVPL